MKDIREEVIDKLKNKTAKDYYLEYREAERRLMESLKELKKFGDECNCDGEESAKIIFEGEFDEIQQYCLNCGGYIQEREWS